MAYYAREEVFNDPEFMDRVFKVLRGELGLDWMRLDTERVRCRPRQSDRGLTYDDIDVGSYASAAIPEKIRHNFSMAPRGSVLPPGLPHLGYTINRKSEVWSANASELFEESKSRHWAPARAIPWTALGEDPYPDDREQAVAQLYTGLTSMAMAMQDMPLRWVWRINQELLEVKCWLCAQSFDAAKLADAFRKRAIAGGSGLGRDQIELEDLLKGVLESGTYPCASAAGNLLLATLMQALLRHIGAVAANPVDQTLTRLAVQDVSRWLTYGIGHLHALLGARPHEGRGIAGHLEEIENLAVGFLGASETFGGLALATAGRRDRAASAVPAITQLYRRLAEEHLDRCLATGMGEHFEQNPLLDLVEVLEER